MNEANFERFENFLKNNLSQTDAQKFESDLESDAALKEDFELHKRAKEAAELLKEQALRKKMNLLWEENVKTEKPKKLSFIWAAAAAIALILVSVWAFDFFGKTYTSEQILAENIFLPKSKEIRGQNPNFESALNGGMKNFEKKNYKAAVENFEVIPDTSGYFSEAQYYLGHVYLQSKEFGKAALAFENVIKQNDPTNIREAKWHLILSKIGDNSPQSSYRELLNEILNNPNHLYFQKAKSLEKMIKSLKHD